MKTELLIEYFSLTADEFVDEINLDSYDLPELNRICPPELPDDYHYCDGKFIEPDEFVLLKAYVKELEPFEYDHYFYNLITRRV